MKINRFIKDAIKNTRALNKSVSVNAPAESKSKKRKFIVKDWTGREMDFGTFRTFDDAWDYLYKKVFAGNRSGYILLGRLQVVPWQQ